MFYSGRWWRTPIVMHNSQSVDISFGLIVKTGCEQSLRMVTQATVAKLRLDWLKRDCSQSRDSFSRFAVSRCFQSGNENLVAGSPFFPQPRSQGSLLPVATELERIWERPSHSRIAWLLATPPMESLLAAILNKINGKFRPLSPQLKMGKWRVLLFARLDPWFGAGGGVGVSCSILSLNLSTTDTSGQKKVAAVEW